MTVSQKENGCYFVDIAIFLQIVLYNKHKFEIPKRIAHNMLRKVTAIFCANLTARFLGLARGGFLQQLPAGVGQSGPQTGLTEDAYQSQL